MKSDKIEFDTRKTVQEIIDALRTFNCNIEKVESNDPFGGYGGGYGPAISVLMSGRGSALEGFRVVGSSFAEWGVQVTVDDLGNKRHVQLVAFGASGFQRNPPFWMPLSKDYRKQIANKIS